jgi:predicted LPLAT superfamily acyltransferase
VPTSFDALLRLPRAVYTKLGGGRKSHWSSVDERGGVLGMRLLFTIYRVCGRRAFTALGYPVAAYFRLTSRVGRTASSQYLSRIRDRLAADGKASPVPLTTFAHMLEFGHAVLDKGAMWAGAFPAEDVEFADSASFEEVRSLRSGALFIGSHLGNVEVVRAYGEGVHGLKVNALVFTGNSAKLNRVMEAVCPKALEHMIQVDSLGPDTVYELEQRLRRGEHVAIMADRVSVNHKERSIHAPFLGRPAPFPEGPFILASLLRCPVYLVFCLKIGPKYRVFLERFADPLELPRADRRAALERTVARYAQRLESYCLLAPTQWFNFFHFWDQADRTVGE